MSTFMAKPETMTRKWYLIDAAGKPMGRVATEVAVLLRGKHKVTFTPHIDCGDHVIVINVAKVVLTGKKLEQKMYRTHSGYIGHLKETKYRILMKSKPELAFTHAVKGMIPDNAIGDAAMKRLRVYKGGEHEHASQKPEIWNLD